MGKERETWGSERRLGFRALLGLATEPLFGRTLGDIVPENGLGNIEIVKAFPYPNPDLALVNSSAIPDKYGVHHSKERILHTINYDELSMGIYGPGIIEAIIRGQKVTLTIEQPFGFNTALSTWAGYVDRIARIYQPAQFIVGNETNVNPHYLPPEDYFPYFVAAKEVINRLSPNTEVLPAAEAYYGKAEYFDEFLSICFSSGVEIGTLPFHFYGYPEELPERIELLKNICRLRGYPNTKLIVTEVSRPENETLNEEELADFLYQTNVVCAQLIGNGVEFAAWFSAYDFGKGNNHALFEYQDGQLQPKPGFTAYVLSSRLLFENVRETRIGSLVKVIAQSAEGISTLAVWNEGDEDLAVRTPRGHFAYDVLGNRLNSVSILKGNQKIPHTVVFIPHEAFNIHYGKTPFPV